MSPIESDKLRVHPLYLYVSELSLSPSISVTSICRALHPTRPAQVLRGGGEDDEEASLRHGRREREPQTPAPEDE